MPNSLPSGSLSLGRRPSTGAAAISFLELQRQLTAAAEEHASTQGDSPPAPASPPAAPVSRTPSQHSALQPPRSARQQEGALRPSSVGGPHVQQPCSDKHSPQRARLEKHCVAALRLLEKLQRPVRPHGNTVREALPPAAIRTCKVGSLRCAAACPSGLVCWLLLGGLPAFLLASHACPEAACAPPW